MVSETPKPGAPAQAAIKLTAKDYKEDVHNDWCPGCGDFGILSALQMALADLQLAPHRTAVFSGIGCSGKTPHYVRTYGVHTLHGRMMPFAQGAKLANPELEIVGVGGDGDGYGIGAGHFMAAGRRNVDMAYIVYDNGVYGLTKGQASPTLKLGVKTKSLPAPNINDGINPLALALSAGYTWIGRGYSYDIKGLKELMKQAIAHKGLALLDVLQPCPTYNNLQTKEWYGGEDRPNKQPRVYKLEDHGYDGRVRDPTDTTEVDQKKAQAFLKSMEWGDTIPTGVFYQIEMPTYEERLAGRSDTYLTDPPAKRVYEQGGKPTTDIAHLIEGVRIG
ncbi:MAG: 2-ketoglutarate ferredoxin oxidoreductase subunit beta [Halobacteriales archaeon]|nr:2-ketoglutarate ferredoxin oxidoreductase subunit beta [Halobacteriales archaeon]